MLLCVCDPFALLVWKQEEEEGNIYEVYDDVMMEGGGVKYVSQVLDGGYWQASSSGRSSFLFCI